MEVLLSTWHVLALSAPYLLVGFLGAGILHVLLPTKLIEKNLSKPGLGSVLRAGAIGLPLPLCSCSVIPVGVSLRRAGASKGATAGFFVSTPEIGIDSYLVSHVLLGPVLAISRVILAFVSAVFVGLGIDTLCEHQAPKSDPIENTCEKCSSSEARWKQILRYAFVDVVDDLSRLLVLGFLLAGVAATLLSDELFSHLAALGVPVQLLMLLLSLPVYVCATSATPFVAVLLTKGLSAGSALIFLAAGPATNISTMLVLKRELGSKALVIYLLGIAFSALAAGYALDHFMGQDSLSAIDITVSHEHLNPFYQVCGLMLSGLLLISLYRKVSRA